MRVRIPLMIMFLALSALALLSAQEEGKEVTVEELYLRNIELQILREQAYSDDRDTKLAALDALEQMVEGGEGDQRVVQPVLEYLAMEGIGRRVRQENRLVNYFPEVRRRAANLLGRLGGDQAKDALVTVLLNDNEPMVRSEAAYALGVVGLNNGNEVVKALVFSLSQEDPAIPDNNFAYAVCLAIDKIARKNNGFKGADATAVYRTLVGITQGNYIKTVKQKALETLEELKRY